MTVVDQFPCDITVPVNGPGEPDRRVTYKEVRLIVAGQDARVVGIIDGTPSLMASATVVGTPPHPARQVNELVTDGGEWWVARSAGCGCRHILKRLERAAVLVAAGLA